MQYTFYKPENKNYLLLVLNSTIIHKQLGEKIWNDILTYTIENDCTNCILDISDSIFGEKIDGIFKLSKYIDNLGFNSSYNFALVSKLKTESLTILEILMKKKNYNYKYFTDFKKAEIWITHQENRSGKYISL